METIGSLLDRLQGLLSKSFLLVGFIPACFFVSLHFLLAYWIIPGYGPFLLALLQHGIANPGLFWPLLALFLFVIGIFLWSLNPLFRQLMEGKFLWKWYRNRLERGQFEQLMSLESQLKEKEADVADYHSQKIPAHYNKGIENEELIPERLLKARLSGKGKGSKIDLKVVTKKYDQLNEQRKRLQPISFSSMAEFLLLLEEKLSAADADENADLDTLQSGSLVLVEYAKNRCITLYERIRIEKELRFPPDLVQLAATTMANIAEVHWSYGMRKYGIDIEYLWLRLLKVLVADKDFLPILEESKTQLDLAVTLSFLFGLTTFAWTTLGVIYFLPDVWVCLFGCSGFLLTWMFYLISQQSYRSFTEAVRSGIDLHRFDLLTALHVPLPANAEEERKLWASVMQAPDAILLAYNHGDKDSSKPAIDTPAPKGIFSRLKKYLFGA